MASLRITLLGGFEARSGSGESIGLNGRKAQALLAYLALPPGEPRSRDKLAVLLWSDRGEQQARGSLRKALSELRKALGDIAPAPLVAGRSAVSLDADAVEVDVTDFETSIGEGTPEALERAVDLYRGDFLDGIAVHDPAFEEWLRIERERLRDRARDAFTRLLDHQTGAGESDRAIATARRLLALDAVQEPVHRALMRLYAGKNDRAMALRQYQACRDVLGAELGLEPEAETERLAQDIRAGAAGTDEEAEPATSVAAILANDDDGYPFGLADQSNIRYCLSKDGASIAHTDVGKGYPLIFAGSWMTHLEKDWENPMMRHYLIKLSKYFTIIRYDQRGNGMSDWDNVDITFDKMVDDLECVIDQYDCEKMAILGASQAASVSIAYLKRRPEKISHLIFYGGYTRGRRRRGSPEATAESEALVTLIRQGWSADNPAYRQTITSLFMPDASPGEMAWFNAFQKDCGPAENIARFREVFDEMDVSDLLDNVKVPTLVIHSNGDSVAPISEGKFLASRIPDAQFIMLKSQNHWLPENDPEFPRSVQVIRDFID